MSPILLDTNVVSVIFKTNHPLRPAALDATDGHELYIAFMTKAEVLVWPMNNDWGARRRAELSEHLSEFTTLLPDDDSPRYWAEVMATSKRLGRPMDAADAWIAATALQWDLPLVTNNFRDFEPLSELTLVRI
jgi:tRNA(fMet)-specific endonuclease VapC